MSEVPATVTRRAHAKINIFLRVLARRDDGYHDVETVVLPISMHDVVTVTAADSLTVEVAGEHADGAPVDPRSNLAGRAAAALAALLGRGPAATVALHKRVPVAAGLGGGSADAAATLHALDELWASDVPAEALAGLGAELGADVPAMLVGEPVLATGRGERLTPVHAAATWWVLMPFPFGVSAADAYDWWDAAPSTGPDPGVLIAALETGDVELLGDGLFNDLQPAIVDRHQDVGAAIAAFLEAGALGAFVSGSGPTVAALARHIAHAETLAAALPGSHIVSAPPIVGPPE